MNEYNTIITNTGLPWPKGASCICWENDCRQQPGNIILDERAWCHHNC